MEYAKGRIGTGCSHLVVAKYAAAGGVISYSEAMILARLVGINWSINQDADVEFYADNVLAESESGGFHDGNVRLTVDGLFDEASRFISGQGEPEQVTYGEIIVSMTKYSAKAVAPYIAIGFIRKSVSNRKTVFTPWILPKTKFKPAGMDAKTQERSVSYQIQELEAVIHRADDDGENWILELGMYTTEAEAIAALNAVMGLEGT